MEKQSEHNKELKEQISKIFSDLFKEIGNNRQQLVTKVLNVQVGILRELGKGKVDGVRQQEILREVNATVRMAAQQLPHLRQAPPQATPPPSTTPTAKKPTNPTSSAKKKVTKKSK